MSALVSSRRGSPSAVPLIVFLGLFAGVLVLPGLADPPPGGAGPPSAAELGRQALLHEVRGLDHQRNDLLDRVRKQSPDHAPALWHTGHVRFDGRWTKARKLPSAAVLHRVTGTTPVDRVEAGPHLRTYNLVVADFSTYFVGRQQVLVHDNTPPRPTATVVPGLSKP